MTKPKAATGKTGTLATPVFGGADTFMLYVRESDWREAISFFQDKIGLMLRSDSHGWAEFNAGKITLALHEAKETTPRETGLIFAVEDCDEGVTQLRARGVPGVTDPRSVAPGVRCFEWKDPFGNTFSAAGK